MSADHEWLARGPEPEPGPVPREALEALIGQWRERAGTGETGSSILAACAGELEELLAGQWF